MNERELHTVLHELDQLSGNALEDRLGELCTDLAVVNILSDETFDDIGIARTTARNVAQRVYAFEDSEGTLTESLDKTFSTDPKIAGHSLDELVADLVMLDDKSGNDQKDFLEGMFEDYAYPSVVSFAVLNDWSLGFSDSTISSALGVKDSLPFYESVAEIVEADDPLTGPEVGQSFEPMLAVPESRGRPDNPVAQEKIDGYRILIHVSDDVTAYSRRQNDVTESLPELQEIDWPDEEYILDGEVVAETGSYSDTSERIGRSAENVEREVEMNFLIFDCITYQGDDVSDSTFENRFDMAMEVVGSCDSSYLDILPLWTDVEMLAKSALEEGQEGIIVKDRDAPYEFGTRSAYWTKEKFDAETVDVRVTDVLKGDKKHNDTMGKLAIESADGVAVGHTGSGFSDGERDEIWNNQDEWVGRTIEVEARGIGSQGNLRMPIYVRDRQADGTADSWSRVKELMKDV